MALGRKKEEFVLGISGTELIIILFFGFLVFGPEKLPELGRTVGRAIRQFRQASDAMSQKIKTEVADPFQEAISPYKEDVENLGAPLREDISAINKNLQETKRAFTNPLKDAWNGGSSDGDVHTGSTGAAAQKKRATVSAAGSTAAASKAKASASEKPLRIVEASADPFADVVGGADEDTSSQPAASGADGGGSAAATSEGKSASLGKSATIAASLYGLSADDIDPESASASGADAADTDDADAGDTGDTGTDAADKGGE